MQKPLETGEIGHYSGNPRLDESQFEEKDIDDDFSRNLWLDDILHDPEFIEDMEDALLPWKEKISKTMDPERVTVHMVTESHIDMAWLWRYAQTRRKGVKTYKKLIEHIKILDGKIVFAASEPQLLQWVKEEDPQLWEEIKKAVETGSIELVGGSWVEPDCMMPSGEAFVRQRLYGMMFYRDEFGKLPKVEWLLDSFGFNVGLPQILKKSGAEYFWTNKMTWNMQTTFPFVFFTWESPDGSRLYTANFGQLKESFDRWEKFVYGRHLLKEGGKRRWSYKDDYSKLKEEITLNEYVPEIGYFTGKGDGGHGPTHQEVVELTMAISAGERIGLKFKWSTVHDYFNEISKYYPRLPIWSDEMYLENHRGTFSNHSEVKRHNRYFENILQALESLATWLSLFNENYKYPYEELEYLWKLTLLNQFHDVLPGSSIPEVYDDCYKMWKESKNKIKILFEQCIKTLPHTPSQNIIFYNPLSWTRKERVFIPLTAVKYFRDLNTGEQIPAEIELDEEGKPPYAKLYLFKEEGEVQVICQPVAAEPQDDMENHQAGWWTCIEIPPYGILAGELRIEPLQSNAQPDVFVDITPIPRITNEYVSIELDPLTGAIKTLKAGTLNNGENLLHGLENNLIHGYLDKSKEWPAWNLTPEYWKYPKNYSQTTDVQIRIADQGPIFSTLEISRKLGKSPIKQQIRLFKDDPKVYFLWSADWKEENTLLKLIFDTETNATEVITDQMYCALSKSTLPETPNDKARYEKTMHKYADLSTPENTWGIAFINEGKYAFDASAGRFRLSLHRSPEYPQPSAEAWVHEERKLRKEKDGTEPPKYSGMGPISARFALFPHRGGALKDQFGKPSNLVKLAADEFNSPILVFSAHSPDLKDNSPNENNEEEKEQSIPSLNYSENLQDSELRIKEAEKITHPLHNLEIYVPSNIQLTVFKRREWEKDDSIILRFVEICGVENTQANIILPSDLVKKIEELKEIDLLERPLEKENQFSWNPEEGEIKFTIQKFEIKSFMAKIKKDE